jgi:hypothetical protein
MTDSFVEQCEDGLQDDGNAVERDSGASAADERVRQPVSAIWEVCHG